MRDEGERLSGVWSEIKGKSQNLPDTTLGILRRQDTETELRRLTQTDPPDYSRGRGGGRVTGLRHSSVLRSQSKQTQERRVQYRWSRLCGLTRVSPNMGVEPRFHQEPN